MKKKIPIAGIASRGFGGVSSLAIAIAAMRG
jgi:hypothetical protein